jgi:hypothetical protein
VHLGAAAPIRQADALEPLAHVLTTW